MLDLKTERGVVIGIGRLKIPKIPHVGFDFDMPLLSFVVIKKENGSHIATCIHMQMDGYGTTVDEACNDMASSVFGYLCKNLRDPELRESAWDNLVYLFQRGNRCHDLWDKYHEVQIELAKNGVVANNDTVLLEKIVSLQNRVKKLEDELVRKDSELEGKNTLVSTLLNSFLGEKHPYGQYMVTDFIVDFEDAEKVGVTCP